ncbi:E3 ubiquitin-protein ligase SH3RF3 [Ctenodactylus gundi]
MDEAALLDLLECAVCLERLDASARVLPCQHTFCRRCLERIVCARRELRCPECRVLVGCGVDELPANILLVRLLDGLRRGPRAPPEPPDPDPAVPGVSPGSCAPAAGRTAQAAKNLPQLPYGKALYSYEGREPGDLKFNKGDMIVLRRRVDAHWFHGELHGTQGFLPASYVQCLQPLPQAPPQGTALYDFEMKDLDRDMDCLTFTKDEVLTVIRRVDDNWAEGMLGDKIGIFPLLYVELNDAAKQLMDMDKPCPAPISMSTHEASVPSEPNAVAGEASSPTLGSAGALRAFHRRADSKKNTKKRHSFTALGASHRASPTATHRRSMEISAPVLISSSDPRAAARIGGLARQPGTTPTQAPALTPPPCMGIVLTPPIPTIRYLALYAYRPQKSDELELHKGEMYRVLEKCRDGWFKGASLRSGLSGVFPGNYVTPLSRKQGSVGPPGQWVHRLPLETLAGMKKVDAGSSRATHPSAQAQDRPTATVIPLRTQSSPSHLPATSLKPRSVVSPQHSQQTPAQTCPLLAMPLTSAASAITPPNVSAANFGGEAGGSSCGGLSTASPPSTGCRPDDKRSEKREKKGGLLKLLAGASTRKKPRSPQSFSPTHDPLAAVGTSLSASLQGALGPGVSSLSVHGRAGSCPVESEMWGALGLEPLHRKAGSLDLDFCSSPSRQAALSMAAIHPEPGPLPRERYRVVVSYPPQSEAEIELKEGDVVFVHRKREDGWYEGTLQRNGRTGLFPGSFVESF